MCSFKIPGQPARGTAFSTADPFVNPICLLQGEINAGVMVYEDDKVELPVGRPFILDSKFPGMPFLLLF